jgi:hypothetical protein
VLLAIASGAGGSLGGKLWEGMVSLVRRPFCRKDGSGGDVAEPAALVPAGTAELATLQQDPGDQGKALALAEILLTRCRADPEFRQALESWWVQAEPVRSGTGNAANTISGGIQHGPVLQGRDFSNITFGAP